MEGKDILIIILAVCVVLISAATIGIRIYNSIKNNNNKADYESILTIIRNELLILFKEAISLNKATQGGFEAIKTYVLDKLNTFIANTEILSDEEKAILTPDFLSNICTPILQSLWYYSLQDPKILLGTETYQKEILKVKIYDIVEDK